MASSSIPATIAKAISARPGVLAEKYVSAAGLCILLYDWLFSLPMEKAVIWSRPWSRIKIVYVILRYGVAAGQILSAHAMSGLGRYESDYFCKVWIIFTGASSILTMALANLVLILRVYALWDHRRNVLLALSIGYTLSVAGTVAFGIVSIFSILDTLIYDKFIFHMCLIQKSPGMWIGIWGIQIAFDIYIAALTFLNSAHRPQPLSVKLITDLQRDGGMFFFALALLRAVNLILSVLKKPSYMVIGFFFIWAMVIVVVCRLLLRLEHLRMPPHKRRPNVYANDTQELNMHQMSPYGS